MYIGSSNKIPNPIIIYIIYNNALKNQQSSNIAHKTSFYQKINNHIYNNII